MTDDRIMIMWNIEDVLTVRPDLTKDQAGEVLHMVKRKHDASIGINWIVIETHADMMFPLEMVDMHPVGDDE